jgi:hypothetical protein
VSNLAWELRVINVRLTILMLIAVVSLLSLIGITGVFYISNREPPSDECPFPKNIGGYIVCFIYRNEERLEAQ